MFYEINDAIHEVNLSDIDSEQLTIGIVEANDIDEIIDHFGFSKTTSRLISGNNSRSQNSLLVYDEYSFGLLKIKSV